jgi:cystathionine gamma-synthase
VATAAHYITRRLPSGSFGGLFSLAFASQRAAEAFYDVLACNKGPSLGTNFTLACLYTILTHYTELNWAAQFGMPWTLVRVSIGLEDVSWLHKVFSDALKAADDAHRAETNGV